MIARQASGNPISRSPNLIVRCINTMPQWNIIMSSAQVHLVTAEAGDLAGQ
jgi:hypothetical protein